VADLRVLGERFAAPATRNAAPAAADAPSEPALNAEDEESEEGALDAANAA
jgi:hypothetical protein